LDDHDVLDVMVVLHHQVDLAVLEDLVVLQVLVLLEVFAKVHRGMRFY
jgi:hypothetical protein